MNGNSLYDVQALTEQLGAVAQLINSRNEQLAHRIEASARALSQNAQKLTDSAAGIWPRMRWIPSARKVRKCCRKGRGAR